MADIYSAGHAVAARARALPAANDEPPTDKQVGFIANLLNDRDWRASDLPIKHVSRCAVINALVIWESRPDNSGITPREASDLIAAIDGRGARINALLEFLGQQSETVTLPEEEYLWRPLTKRSAAKLIEWLLTLDLNAEPQAVVVHGPHSGHDLGFTADQVPAGRYALDTSDGAHNAVAFYRVDRPTEGKWAGHVFVKLMASDDTHRLPRSAAVGVLRRIAELGAEECSARYGHLIGECGVCGRTLTNDESRERGIGPVCAAKAGW